MKYTGTYSSPIGTIVIEGNDDAVTALYFSDEAVEVSAVLPTCIRDTVQQLEEYFTHKRTHFDLPLALDGTEFQQHVWDALQDIPYGTTVSYKDVANDVKRPKAVRAVGNANNKNAIPIIIPCHRVVGSNGDLTGYAYGLQRKAWLLEHERKQVA